MIPELQVSDLQDSMRFYRTAGFAVAYDRPEDAFVMLVRDGVALMLESVDGPGRRLGDAALKRPFGRGINFQIRVADADEVHRGITAGGGEPVTELEDRWFRVGTAEVGNREFVVCDPTATCSDSSRAWAPADGIDESVTPVIGVVPYLSQKAIGAMRPTRPRSRTYARHCM